MEPGNVFEVGIEKVRPIITPIITLLKSRKFMVALAVVIAQFVVRAVPTLAPYASEIGFVVLVVGGVLMGTIAAEDAAEKWALRPTTTDQAIKDMVLEALDQFITTDDGEDGASG